ncbi:MAG: tRNA dihydrouridine(20/20a) synthase DusA [Cardiobacteriaceae bacterium]|nr:tRNA dihydrouridine(20/20a) synthase DusA [Cardiobacteriaceae bacterium]
MRTSIAPMLDWTTPQCRRLHRIFTEKTELYSEMISTGAIIHGDTHRHLNHHHDEPCVLQLGGGKPDELAQACEKALCYGYSAFNLNAGCPSDRVQNNKIGACLMLEPSLIAECLSAMQSVSNTPVTLKHRLGIDEQDERQVLSFIETIMSESPCRYFIVHARKAWLKGLSPKENREIPPLNYHLVYEAKRLFPEATIILNGGVENFEQIQQHLEHVDGVMIGRAAYHNPEIMLQFDTLYGLPAKRFEDVLPQIRQCLENALANGETLSSYTRHLLGLFSGKAGAKQFRRILSEETRTPDAGIELWDKALLSLVN